MANIDDFGGSDDLVFVSDTVLIILFTLFILESFDDVFEEVDDEDFVRCFILDPSARENKKKR